MAISERIREELTRAGFKNAFKHGRYTAEEIANRREITALLRTMRALARATRELE
jgi:hypothetical protein